MLCMPINPSTPLTLWALIVVITVALLSFVPLLYTLRQLSRMKDGDSLKNLSLQLDETPIKAKIQLVVADCIDEAVSKHDEALFAHPQALARYPNMDQFNGGLQRITAEVSGVRALIESNERRRSDDMGEIRKLVETSSRERKQDFDELRANVARALGRKREDDI